MSNHVLVSFAAAALLLLANVLVYISLLTTSTAAASHLSAHLRPHGLAPEVRASHNQRRQARHAHITSSVSSQLINTSGANNNLPPRDDKMDDLFYSTQDSSVTSVNQDNEDDQTTDQSSTSGRRRLAATVNDDTHTKSRLQLVVDNSIDEPEMLTNNHQLSTGDSFPSSSTSTVSNSRHYNSYASLLNNHHSSSSSSSSSSHNQRHHHNHHHHYHSQPHYGKYGSNMFANNYNLNYIHSFLTSKPTSSSSSSSLSSLQTMQSLLNSNPNGLTLANYGAQTGHQPLSVATAAASHYAGNFALTPNGTAQVATSNTESTRAPYTSTTADHPMISTSSSSCGRQQVAYREPRVVGGNRTFEGEFPWAVSIQRHGNHHCGGVIVGRRWILTAAHCVRSQLVGNLMVRTGGHTLSRSINEVNGHLEKDIPVEQIIMHDDFSRYDNLTSSQLKSSANTNNADIALLRLKHDIRWNELAWPVCFPHREAGNFSGHEAIVVGWGKLNEKSEEFSNELQKVKLTIIDNKVCQNWFRQAGRDMPIDDRIICAGFKNGGKDACHGDSGGPLLSRMNGQYVVVGVVSTGIGCARPLLPGLYSRVSSYIGWIERYITDH